MWPGIQYIGTTKHSTQTRIKEHERHCRLKHPEKSAVAEHPLKQTGHEILFQDTEVLDNKGKPLKSTNSSTASTEKKKVYNQQSLAPSTENYSL
ncbi:hypothetical protein JRQ81_002494 [Phrynocephalus forsythii]|uniref:GIY-YIG domain-containing protein n=1 Tax=Phrynocephalus forsythii TaxID=171643 RepID=A0A9Q0XLB3_9SAUR|nr:hypothetical protein JRQ81_002494 [Phrynocephalus forsythii]